MSNKELSNYLEKHGFENIHNADNPVYTHGEYDITVFVKTEDEGLRSISFGYSEDGWWSIDNPSIDQIINIIDVHAHSKFMKDKIIEQAQFQKYVV